MLAAVLEVEDFPSGGVEEWFGEVGGEEEGDGVYAAEEGED